MQLVLNPESYVATYNVVVDNDAPIPVTPNADGSATFDLSSYPPGSHTVTADACNASGCSAFMSPLSFTMSLPIPAVPTGSISS